MVRLLQILLHKIYEVVYHQSDNHKFMKKNSKVSLLITLFGRSICKKLI